MLQSNPSVVEAKAVERQQKVELLLHLGAVVINFLDEISVSAVRVPVEERVHLLLADLIETLLREHVVLALVRRIVHGQRPAVELVAVLVHDLARLAWRHPRSHGV